MLKQFEDAIAQDQQRETTTNSVIEMTKTRNEKREIDI